MNKKNKGRKFERIVASLLGQAGWCVHLAQPSIGYNPSSGRYYARPQDIFGADIIAIRDARPIILIQVTSDSSVSRKAKKFWSFPFPWEIIRCYVFQAKKRSGRWRFRVVCVERGGVEEASEYIVEDLLGKVFWENRNLFEAKYEEAT